MHRHIDSKGERRIWNIAATMISFAQPALFFRISIEVNSNMQNSLSSLQCIELSLFTHAWKSTLKARGSKGTSPMENSQGCLKIPSFVQLQGWLHIYDSNAELKTCSHMKTSSNSRGWMENPGAATYIPVSSRCDSSQLHRVFCRKIWNIRSSTDSPCKPCTAVHDEQNLNCNHSVSICFRLMFASFCLLLSSQWGTFI